ncbi:DUF6143 family protein [Brevibacillus sp. NRS-1366]|uniref:DUF6143 family protein n=1 Tax=Brevibacillus sp. NRS-1366 TaxID=3233899 RepID=UPI003D262A5A
MTKSSFTQQPSYFYGMPDVYMQMGYYPFPTQPATEQMSRSVHVPYAMSMASGCKYYLGQSEKIVAGGKEQGFGALVNPLRSTAVLYVNRWLVTNSSAQPLEAHIWFGKASTIVGSKTSRHVTPGYVQLPPCPAVQGQILFGSCHSDITRDGTVASTRIIPPMTTVEQEPSGQWILGPGMAMMIHVPPTSEETPFFFSVDWWEQSVFG